MAVPLSMYTESYKATLRKYDQSYLIIGVASRVGFVYGLSSEIVTLKRGDLGESGHIDVMI